jgi:hypothetical protein
MYEHSEPVIETLRQSGLDPNSYLVFGGAAMAMHGIRSANDVDLLIEQTVFRELSGNLHTPGGQSLMLDFEKLDNGEEHRLVSVTKPENDALPLDLRGLTKYERLGATVFNQWMARAIDLKTSLGVVHVMKLEDILASKAKSPRLNDRQDVDMIRGHLTR